MKWMISQQIDITRFFADAQNDIFMISDFLRERHVMKKQK